MITNNTVRPAHFMRCRCGPLIIVTILLLTLQSPDLCFGSGYTNYVIVATIGQAGITGILGGPSINNNGLCAFAAQVSGGETIYAGNGSGNPTNLTTFISVNRSFSSYLQINDAGIVAGEDTLSGAPPGFVIREWNANVPDAYTIIALGFNNSFVLEPGINNSGQVSYIGFDGSSYTLYSTNVANPHLYYQFFLGNSLYRPMIADNGSIVGKLGSSTASGPIRVFNNTLATFVDVAVAGSGGQFTSLDSLPGISQDGQVVAFYGIDANGPGIFIVVAGNNGFVGSTPFRIAGSTNGFSSFATFSRVAVKTLPLNQLGFVAYLGTTNGNLGLFVSEFQTQGATSPPIVGPISVVVMQGQTLSNLSGTVQTLAIQDPLNTNREVAFLVQTSTGAQAIVSAIPSGLSILPTFDSSITSLPDAAAIESSINNDISAIDSYITASNPVTVTIDFKSKSTGLAASLTPQADLNYSTYLAALQANPIRTAYNTNALANMSPGPGTGINGATQVYLTAANLAAIGQTAMAASLVAGNGGFNSIISFNFSIMNDSRPDADPMKYDLQSAAAHEIDEVLGIGGNGSQLGSGTPPTSLPTDVGPLDFFRYSSAGTSNLSFTLGPNATPYFSIDGGVTDLVHFNQYGNGSDYGDWGDGVSPADGTGNTPPQVQDAFGTPGAMPNLGRNEIIAFNVVGWTLVAPVQPPALNIVFVAPNQIVVSWPSGTGYVELQQSPSLTSPSWVTVPNGSANPAVIQIGNSPNTQQFYRIFSPAAAASSAPAGPLIRSLAPPNTVTAEPVTEYTSKVVTHVMFPRRP